MLTATPTSTSASATPAPCSATRPKPIVEALQREGANGLTTMMPSADAAEVGALLHDRFGLPFWQVTATASDANRAVMRWCRAITGRKQDPGLQSLLPRLR
jgi:hypothetical protein